MGWYDAAVGKQFAGVFEQDDAVAQAAPALFGVGGDDTRGFPVQCVGVGAGGTVLAHRLVQGVVWSLDFVDRWGCRCCALIHMPTRVGVT